MFLRIEIVRTDCIRRHLCARWDALEELDLPLQEYGLDAVVSCMDPPAYLPLPTCPHAHPRSRILTTKPHQIHRCRMASPAYSKSLLRNPIEFITAERHLLCSKPLLRNPTELITAQWSTRDYLLDPDSYHFCKAWLTWQNQWILMCLFSIGIFFGPWGLKNRPRGPQGAE